MTADEHPLIAHTRPSVWQKLGYGLVVLAVAAGFAGLGLALSAKDEASETAAKVEASNPCVDVASGPKVRLSEGCRAVVDNINIFCARNVRYCRQSERRAFQVASREAAEREIGPTAQLPGGGGGSKGKDPQSPQTPSPRNGGGGGPSPQPDTPRPSGPGTPRPNEPSVPTQPGAEEPVNPPPVVDAPGLIPQPLKPILCDVLGVCLDP